MCSAHFPATTELDAIPAGCSRKVTPLLARICKQLSQQLFSSPRSRTCVIQHHTYYGRPIANQSQYPLLGQRPGGGYHRRRQWCVLKKLRKLPHHTQHSQPVGIGLAIAATLLQNGAAKIYIIGRRKNVLDEAIAKLESSPSAPKSSSVLSSVSADVSDLESVGKAVAQIKEEVGYVDVLINNAGVLGPKSGQPIHDAQSIEALRDAMVLGMDGNDWSQAFEINTKAVVGVSALFLPLLEAANTRRGWAPGRVQGTGNARKRDTSKLKDIGVDEDDDRMAHIITVASVASYMRWISAGLAYNATKSAAAQIGKILATFLAEWGVRSNIICPGPYPSEMTSSNPLAYGTNQIPQGRMGNINDMAGLLLFMVGKGGAYMNGVSQLTDGGRAAVFPSTY